MKSKVKYLQVWVLPVLFVLLQKSEHHPIEGSSQIQAKVPEEHHPIEGSSQIQAKVPEEHHPIEGSSQIQAKVPEEHHPIEGSSQIQAKVLEEHHPIEGSSQIQAKVPEEHHPIEGSSQIQAKVPEEHHPIKGSSQIQAKVPEEHHPIEGSSQIQAKVPEEHHPIKGARNISCIYMQCGNKTSCDLKKCIVSAGATITYAVPYQLTLRCFASEHWTWNFGYFKDFLWTRGCCKMKVYVCYAKSSKSNIKQYDGVTLVASKSTTKITSSIRNVSVLATTPDQGSNALDGDDDFMTLALLKRIWLTVTTIELEMETRTVS
ncbi:hypothetical protein CHS0354_013525 [Potamilus streckersoni]|uniref:Uncharacterized protein n=1 Tax=Potamilus streckersoni TaxID=2493646 RepID=A0AAE0T8Q8_9BIVA|nr:hypothetical protein CHS0354_013525 [Potamilus streckersoni]